VVILRSAGVLLVAATLGLLVSTIFARNKEQTLYRYRFAANERGYMFLHAVDNDLRVLVTFDPETNQSYVEHLPHGHIWSVSAAPSNDAFYIAYSDYVSVSEFKAGRRPISTLSTCSMAPIACRPVFTFNRQIANPIDLGPDGILFVSGEPELRSDPFTPNDPFVGLREFDFFWRDSAGNIHRLTEWKAASLVSASSGNGRVVFELHPRLGSSRSKRAPRLPTSEIFSATFRMTEQGGSLEHDEAIPAIEVGKELDTKPYVSPDGSKVAILSASNSTEQRGRRYDVVIADIETKEILFVTKPEQGAAFSPPIFINNQTVRFMSYDGETYTFRQIDLAAKRETTLGHLQAGAIKPKIN